MRSALFSLLFVSLHCAGLELYCEGEWDSGRTRQEFLITVDPASGFMWGFEPLAAIGFFDVDDKKISSVKILNAIKLNLALIVGAVIEWGTRPRVLIATQEDLKQQRC
jgi:hypothetical protein